MKRRTRLAFLAVVLATALAAPDSGARPGGGQSFSRPSTPSRPSSPSPSRPSSPSPSRPSSPSWPSSPSPSRPSSPSWPSSPSSPSYPSYPSSPSYPSTSPGHGDEAGPGFTRAFWILLLAVALMVGVVVYIIRQNYGLHGPEWETGADGEGDRERRQRVIPQYRSLVAAIAQIRESDPEFSFVLFEDFLYALYTEAHTARGEGRLEALSPYLSLTARVRLEALGQRTVRTVIVGALTITDVKVGGFEDPTEATATFVTNYAEVDADGTEHAFYSSERWTLERPPGAKSRAPERARVIDCPNCGAPLDKLIGGVCGYCNKNVVENALDWTVRSIQVLEREHRPPILTGETEEVGTSDPTLIAEDVQVRWKALTAADPALDWNGFSARVGVIFRAFHEAWTGREPLKVRPYLSDNLFQAQLYWIDAYKRQGLVNRTDGAHIVTVHLCRVVSDARFDAVTVRVFASGLDYTVNEAGKVVGGNKERQREYSEYWTLIRGLGKTGAPHIKPECPSCGAALEVNMAGSCKYCNAKVTAGEFDWVLSRIEQDEVYEG